MLLRRRAFAFNYVMTTFVHIVLHLGMQYMHLFTNLTIFLHACSSFIHVKYDTCKSTCSQQQIFKFAVRDVMKKYIKMKENKFFLSSLYPKKEKGLKKVNELRFSAVLMQINKEKFRKRNLPLTLILSISLTLILSNRKMKRKKEKKDEILGSFKTKN